MRLAVDHHHADTAKFVLFETEGGTAGVIVDSVQEVLTITTDQIESMGVADSDYVDGVAKLDKRLSILLNPDGFLAGGHVAV